MKTKTCTVCKKLKPIKDFYKLYSYTKSECKECSKIFSKEYRKNHIERVKETKSKYYKENREWLLVCMREWAKKNYKKNKKELIKKVLERYYRNKEKLA